MGRKKPKTLSGIETPQVCGKIGGFPAGKNLKPYQGLKRLISALGNFGRQAGKNLKPYQGLKRIELGNRDRIFKPEKT